jgi:hypothetical protein
VSDTFTPTPNGPHIEHAMTIASDPAVEALRRWSAENPDADPVSLATAAVAVFLEALADAGWRLQPPNTVLMPTSQGQAKLMILLGEKWLQDAG